MVPPCPSPPFYLWEDTLISNIEEGGPEFMADRAMVLMLQLRVNLSYELYSTLKKHFALDETMHVVTMKCN